MNSTTYTKDKLADLIFYLLEQEDPNDWREIDGTDGKYFVSTEGEIISLCQNKPRKMKPYNCNGYLYITINGKNKRINRLVGNAWLENNDNKPVVHHLSHNKLDNSVNNICWATYKENSQEYQKFRKSHLS